MKQAFLPFVLSSIGFVVIVLAVMTMPLFEWRIQENPTSSWIWQARLGESFDNGSYLIRKGLFTQDQRDCLQEDFVISRSLREEKLEQLAETVNKSIPWLYGLGLIEIILSGVYILWFTIEREKLPATIIVLFPLIVGCCLTNILVYSLKVSPLVITHSYIGRVNCYPNTITLNAELTHIYFAMPIVLMAGILLEVGALGIMVKEITRTATKSKESSEPTVG